MTRIRTPPGGRRACALCPGHEHETPTALLELPGDADERWSVRVVPNKFAVLSPAENRSRVGMHTGLSREEPGAGHHELVIESARHELRMVDMSPDEVARVLDVYHARYMALRDDPVVAYVIVFKNSGMRAGASLDHPHSQIVAAPVAPLGLEHRYRRAVTHYSDTEHCLYCDLLDVDD